MERSSEETIIVATYSNWNDAEVAKSFLEDRGISSFVAADEVHPPVQLAHGARLRVMTSRVEEAVEALDAADMLPRDASAEDREHAEGATKRLTTWALLVVFALILTALLAAVL